MRTNYYCQICKKRFNVWKFWTKVKYQDMAITTHIDGQDVTHYWKEVYCMKCAKENNL